MILILNAAKGFWHKNKKPILIYSKFEDWVVKGTLPYADTLLTININDDGAPTAKGSHNNPKLTGAWDSFPYLEEMMERTLAQTEKLVPEKLILLLERYQGKSLALPGVVGVDDTLYGSLAVYQKEIVDEMHTWMNNHSVEEMEQAIRTAIAELVPDAERTAYLRAWDEIKGSY